MDDGLVSLGSALNGVTSKLGMGEARNLAIVWGRWAEIVGTEIASHAEPTSLRKGVLRIRTDSPAWATEITYLARDLRERINAAAGEALVQEVKVWSGPGAIGASAATDKKPAHERSEAADDRPVDPVEAVERARRAWERRRG